MRTLQIPDAETMILALQDEIRRSEEARYDHRLHGLLLVAQGMSCREVAQILGDAPRTVENWVHRFEEEGLAGLVDGARPGRPNPQQQQPIDVLGLEPGDYTVTLVAKAEEVKHEYPDSLKCKDAVCSTTVTLKKEEKVLPRPCCVSPWLFRTFGGWVEAQGSEVNDWIMTADGEKGDFKFDFNQGLGFGLEIERLWPWKEPWTDRKLSDARLGWTLGLFRANLDTRWVFDSPQHWIMDDDRVPMLALTTGLNFHWRHQSWLFFAGPMVGFVSFEDGSYADGTTKTGTFEANFDDSFAFGARVGFDTFIGECWGITGGLEYLKFSTEADFSGRSRDVDVDPLILKAGFVYHF